ncbi:MAG: hypothetical protein ACKOTB_06145, partial [Planctomycetia bacterium]
GGGRVYEVSDLPSVVVAPEAVPIAGHPPLAPEPGGFERPGLPAPEGVVSEAVVEPVPADATLSERIQGFVGEGSMPSSPGLLAYDSAAAIEPDGTVVPASKWLSMADCLRCSGEACWVFRGEALALWRSAPASRPLFTTLSNYSPGPPATGILGPTVLVANQLTSDPLAAGRLSLARVDDCGRGFDAAYIWAGNFYAERSLPYALNSYALASPGIYGNPWGLDPPAPPINAVQMQLVSSLQSGEINLREPFGFGATRFLLGFRWQQWRVTWSMTDEFTDPSDLTVTGVDSWKTSCLNNLYGGQIGLDSVLWNRGQGGMRLEGLAKAGAYYNAPHQSSAYSYINTAPFVSPYKTVTINGPANCAFVGEVGLTTVVPLRKNLDLRCGYFGMWLSGLAQPTRQLSGQTLIPTPVDPPQGSLSTNGSVVLQGVSLGLAGRW